MRGAVGPGVLRLGRFASRRWSDADGSTVRLLEEVVVGAGSTTLGAWWFESLVFEAGALRRRWVSDARRAERWDVRRW